MVPSKYKYSNFFGIGRNSCYGYRIVLPLARKVDINFVSKKINFKKKTLRMMGVGSWIRGPVNFTSETGGRPRTYPSSGKSGTSRRTAQNKKNMKEGIVCNCVGRFKIVLFGHQVIKESKIDGKIKVFVNAHIFEIQDRSPIFLQFCCIMFFRSLSQTLFMGHFLKSCCVEKKRF